MLSKWACRKRSQKMFPWSEVGRRCRECGSTNWVQRHHDDYQRPDLVKILCKKCHALADQAAGTLHIKKPRNCRICKAMFMHKHSKQTTCLSTECRAEAGRIDALKRWGVGKRLANCILCGVEFLRPLRTTKKTCSRPCLLAVESANAHKRWSSCERTVERSD